MNLRPYQIQALEASKSKFERGIRRQIITLPTGMGKTVVFASVPSFFKFDRRILVLVHREELATQAADKLRRINPFLKVGIEMADKHASPEDLLVVGSVQTLGRKESKRLAALDPQTFDSIIVDECHHCTAESYLNILEHFKLFVPDNNKLLLGCTATPNRSDGVGLRQVFEEIVYQKPILDAIKEGWLVDVRGVRVRTTTDLNSVRTQAGDFKADDLAGAVNTEPRNDMIAREWLERAGNRKTLVFCVDIEHSKKLAEAFQRYGVAAQAVWGNDKDRAMKLDAHRQGTLQVLTNCAVLTEGYDDPSIQCVIMARPTKSGLLFTQMAGRGLRLPEGVNNLIEAKQSGVALTKQDCLLMDVVDNTDRHALVTLASIFGMGAKTDLKNQTVTAALKAYEAVRADHPDVDLSKCEDITKIQAYAEEVDLFQVKYEPEVLEGSKLQWHKVAEGIYQLFLPGDERVTIESDLLGKWNVKGTVCGSSFSEVGLNTLQTAFSVADSMIMAFGKKLLTLVKRAASWHNDMVTPAQIRQLKRFRIPFDPNKLTKGEASKLISRGFAGRFMKKSA